MAADRFFTIREYLRYLFKAKSNLYIHSPFTYEFMNKVIRDKSVYPAYPFMSEFRRSLYQDSTKLVYDHVGAGSSLDPSKERTLSSIARQISISENFAKLLFRIVNHVQCKNILEFGTGLGLATASLSLGNENGQIITIEGNPVFAQKAKEHFRQWNLSNVELREGLFEIELPDVLSKWERLDLVYFDGNHQRDATITYFEQCLTRIQPETIFIFDDIYWSRDMKAAWHEIKSHDKVTLSIDLFRWGIVFFRTGILEKQHFRLLF